MWSGAYHRTRVRLQCARRASAAHRQPGVSGAAARRRPGRAGLGGPPGWPPGVPPPGERGWDHRASAWLLDHCPPDYRLYPAWRRHPVALAWFTVRHLDAQLDAMRSAYREVRVDLVDDIGPEGVAQVLGRPRVRGGAAALGAPGRRAAARRAARARLRAEALARSSGRHVSRHRPAGRRPRPGRGRCRRARRRPAAAGSPRRAPSRGARRRRTGRGSAARGEPLRAGLREQPQDGGVAGGERGAPAPTASDDPDTSSTPWPSMVRSRAVSRHGPLVGAHQPALAEALRHAQPQPRHGERRSVARGRRSGRGPARRRGGRPSRRRRRAAAARSWSRARARPSGAAGPAPARGAARAAPRRAWWRCRRGRRGRGAGSGPAR